MKRRFRDEDILRFLYDEMSPQENEGFLDALAKDEDLWARYEYFQEVEDKLSSVKFEPSDASVKKVMDFVRADSKARSKKAGLLGGHKTGMIVAMAALLLTCLSLGVFQGEKGEVKPVAKVERPQLVHEVVDNHISWEHDEIDAQLRDLKKKTEDVKTGLLDDDFL